MQSGFNHNPFLRFPQCFRPDPGRGLGIRAAGIRPVQIGIRVIPAFFSKILLAVDKTKSKYYYSSSHKY
jgi:hypothetical protein